MVLGYDLVKGEVVGEVKCPAPNDVCLNSDGTKMWAGCGSRMGKVVFGGGAGTIHEASTTAPFGATQVLDRGQGTMAGIAEKDGQIYCAHLQRMSCYNVGEDTGWRFWKGNDPDDGKYYLCARAARGLSSRAGTRADAADAQGRGPRGRRDGLRAAEGEPRRRRDARTGLRVDAASATVGPTRVASRGGAATGTRWEPRLLHGIST